jgi:hypothetical protein
MTDNKSEPMTFQGWADGVILDYFATKAFGVVQPIPEVAAGLEEPYKPVSTKEETVGALKGVELIKKERIRQIAEEGYSVEGDEGRAEELLRAGTAYQQYALIQFTVGMEEAKDAGHPSEINWIDGLPLWPWDAHTWKPSDDPQRNWIKGAALIAAALDVL